MDAAPEKGWRIRSKHNVKQLRTTEGCGNPGKDSATEKYKEYIPSETNITKNHTATHQVKVIRKEKLKKMLFSKEPTG